MGGIRRGLQAAVHKIAAARQPLAMIDLIATGI